MYFPITAVFCLISCHFIFQTHVAESEDKQSVVIQYDPNAVLATVNTLNQAAIVNYEEAKLSDVISDIMYSKNISIDHQSLGALNDQEITLEKRNATLGECLSEILASIECDFILLPNGKLVIRKLSPTAISPRHEEVRGEATKVATATLQHFPDDYKLRALEVAKRELKKRDLSHSRKPTFEAVQYAGKICLLIRFAVPEGARGGDWMLWFDPKRPMADNPIEIKLSL